MQPPDDTQSTLFARIVAAIENGGRLTESILDYIDASLFPVDADRLAAFLAGDETESERDSLLDLIFYPDLAIQIGLEPLLEAAGTTRDDEGALHDRLLRRPIHARVSMPDGRVLGELEVPDFIKSQYLERLNISRHLDPHVATAIDNGVSPAHAAIVKVRLRNARICLTAGQRLFLGRFFARMTDSDPDYLACLDLVLPLLEKAGEAIDLYELLVSHKRSLFRSLQEARRFETLLRQSNMEILMLQGIRAPHAPRAEMLHRMRLIDLVCYGIFGRTEAIATPVERPLRHVSDLDDPEAAVQSLLRNS